MAANGSTTRVLKDLALRRLVHPPGLSHFASNGLPPPSHDTTSAAYHVTQASFLLQLDLAVQASWAARHRSKYVDVKVLLMTWQSDDLGVEREAQALLSVFRDLYRFDCEYWQIPDRDSAREATKKVIAHMERASSSPDNLFIFYYAGHASPNPHFPGGLPTWVAKYCSQLHRGLAAERGLMRSRTLQPHAEFPQIRLQLHPAAPLPRR
ncbi:uncharacterized protein THITE_2120742 [Thermothielavioides terrestris NRRL 8126]|jgi:hypothetical protein|uniref:Peptidase C14 caspase domain-containing protein n=1 Tax=Thermothielavioides terrestris (strain ATCC 38088 / NRRL 8126) TaxID=578455 RepID=G2RDI9_THETT|nr:uncharacterized protein THITE_2120742 [Thermothielavioides terrestris NRRL 8126]AEO69971.1 hypothetical protein THITE_2120742 [Thermothielavioides terrestris NRRL 8126]